MVKLNTKAQASGDIILHHDDGKPSKLTKLTAPVLAILATLGLVIGLVIVIVTIFAGANNDSPLTTVREATPTLEIYSKLPEEMTVGELIEQAKNINSDITVEFYSDGSGVMQIPDQPDSIVFDHDLATDILGETEDSEEIDYSIPLDEEEQVEDSITVIDYQVSDVIDNIRYSYLLGDLGYVIEYSKEDNVYSVFDMNDVFNYSSKKEAIDAYLAPEVDEEKVTFEGETTNENN